MDLVARGGELEDEENDAGSGRSGRQGGRATKRTAIYKDHLSNAELQKGMREGKLHQGTLVANRFRPGSASVMCDSVSEVSQCAETTPRNRSTVRSPLAVECVLPVARCALRSVLALL